MGSARLRHARHHIGYPKTYEGLHSKIFGGMGKATAVYIRDSDRELFERAERYARARRMPMSGLIMAALEEYLAQHDPGPAPKR